MSPKNVLTSTDHIKKKDDDRAGNEKSNVYSCNGELVNIDDLSAARCQCSGREAIALYELGVVVGGLEEWRVLLRSNDRARHEGDKKSGN